MTICTIFFIRESVVPSGHCNYSYGDIDQLLTANLFFQQVLTMVNISLLFQTFLYFFIFDFKYGSSCVLL